MIITYIMTYLRKEYGLSYMPRATEQTENLLQATLRMGKQCVETVTTKRPERKYIILTLCADFIARMTFTGDMGTLYDYLTLPKFAYSKEDYGFLLATRYVSDITNSICIIICFFSLVKDLLQCSSTQRSAEKG